MKGFFNYSFKFFKLLPFTAYISINSNRFLRMDSIAQSNENDFDILVDIRRYLVEPSQYSKVKIYSG